LSTFKCDSGVGLPREIGVTGFEGLTVSGRMG